MPPVLTISAMEALWLLSALCGFGPAPDEFSYCTVRWPKSGRGHGGLRFGADGAVGIGTTRDDQYVFRTKYMTDDT